MQTLFFFIHHFAVQRSYIIHTSFPDFQKLTCIKHSFTIRAESNRLLPSHTVPSHAQIHLGIPHSHFQFCPCLPHPCGITPSASQPETGNQYPWLGIPSLIDFVFRKSSSRVTQELRHCLFFPLTLKLPLLPPETRGCG